MSLDPKYSRLVSVVHSVIWVQINYFLCWLIPIYVLSIKLLRPCLHFLKITFSEFFFFIFFSVELGTKMTKNQLEAAQVFYSVFSGHCKNTVWEYFRQTLFHASFLMQNCFISKCKNTFIFFLIAGSIWLQYYSLSTLNKKNLLIDRMQMRLKRYLIWKRLRLSTVSWPSQVSESGTANRVLSLISYKNLYCHSLNCAVESFVGNNGLKTLVLF